jgi:hypothetical protein
MMKPLGGFFVSVMLLRVAACGALLWFRVHPGDWQPLAVDLLRGVCWACLAASLTRRFVILKNVVALWSANRPRWRFR